MTGEASERNRVENSGLDSGEDRRQLEHMLPLGFAFTLGYLSFIQALALALVALIYGAFLSGRINKSGVRPEEKTRGFSMGKITYALAVLALIIIFWQRVHIVAGAWAVLALGDSVSNLAGRRWGAKKLFWSAQKSWAGSLGFLLAAWLGSVILILWTASVTGAELPSEVTVTAVCGLASAAAALTETLPLPLDDNLTSPLAAAGIFAIFL